MAGGLIQPIVFRSSPLWHENTVNNFPHYKVTCSSIDAHRTASTLTLKTKNMGLQLYLF